MSAAKPKIADYPFTTLHPNLGVVESGETRYTIADVPGLIEARARARGSASSSCATSSAAPRCSTSSTAPRSSPAATPISDLDVILGELAAYPVPDGQLPLLERQQLIALNKIDVPEAQELADLVRPELESRGYRVSRSPRYRARACASSPSPSPTS